ncbi:MAG TPA: glycogen synthase GlgA [Elusimicrobia bacterium]|nr:glycogen synthase GlgA [Elusimicrobiota bacterium]
MSFREIPETLEVEKKQERKKIFLEEERKMKILITSPESVPFAKTGGLADVVGALPKFLKQRKQDVRLIIPKYKKIDTAKFGLELVIKNLLIPIGEKTEIANIWQAKLERTVLVYFVENDKYFARDELYRTPAGDYPDNAERFIFFSRACLEAVKALAFQPEIIHCHDWQVGLIPAYLKTLYRIDGFFHSTRTIFTIHNIAYQGFFPKETLSLAGFSWLDFTPEKLEYYDQVNFLKAGIVYSDIVNTVSPTYAKEIQSSNEFGRGMEGILKKRTADLYGITNGIDYKEWDPAKDKYISARYTKKSLDKKKICKTELGKVIGLETKENIPLLGMISRLDSLKGLDILAEAMTTLMKENLQLVILGLGDQKYHDLLKAEAKKYPAKIALQIKFDNVLAHQIYAGCDFFLMPSRFEPCGLTQLIAMRYGTIPIVHKTGGLADTVEPFSLKTGKGNGFVFTEYKSQALITAVKEALSVYGEGKLWAQVVQNAMNSDFSWNKAVSEYLKLYQLAREK